MTGLTPSECAGQSVDVVAEHGEKPRLIPRDPDNEAERQMTPQDDFEYEQEQRT